MKINDLLLWEAYSSVAKQGNFANAARSLRTPVSQISKRVAKLEATLGVRLFTRSTRVVKLTDEGRGLLERTLLLLEESAILEQAFEDKQKISGKLRLTTAPHIAHRFLLPILLEVKKRHPGLAIEVELSETVYDLIESQFDIALRIDEPEDSGYVYRKLFSNDLVICASPSYLSLTKHPLKTPKDLVHHPILIFDALRTQRFVKTGQALSEFNLKQDVTSTNGLFLAELARHGMGVLIRSRWDVVEDLEAGRLVEVLHKHPLEPYGNAYAVIPSRKLLAPRVRAFMELVMEHAGRR